MEINKENNLYKSIEWINCFYLFDKESLIINRK